MRSRSRSPAQGGEVIHEQQDSDPWIIAAHPEGDWENEERYLYRRMGFTRYSRCY